MSLPSFLWSKLKSFQEDPKFSSQVFKSFLANRFVLIDLPPNHSEISLIENSFQLCTQFFQLNDDEKNTQKYSARLGYKKLAQKERYSFRRLSLEQNVTDPSLKMPISPNLPPPIPNFHEKISSLFDFLSTVADTCLNLVLNHIDVEHSLFKQEYYDYCFISPETKTNRTEERVYISDWKKSSLSILNIYNYFNELNNTEENCVKHVDPGLLTVLTKGSKKGLEVFDSDKNDWYLIENVMKENQLIVIIGESLELLSNRRMHGLLHRVGHFEEGSRLNIAFELRPRKHIFHPWNSEQELQARKKKS